MFASAHPQLIITREKTTAAAATTTSDAREGDGRRSAEEVAAEPAAAPGPGGRVLQDHHDPGPDVVPFLRLLHTLSVGDDHVPSYPRLHVDDAVAAMYPHKNVLIMCRLRQAVVSLT